MGRIGKAFDKTSFSIMQKVQEKYHIGQCLCLPLRKWGWETESR